MQEQLSFGHHEKTQQIYYLLLILTIIGALLAGCSGQPVIPAPEDAETLPVATGTQPILTAVPVILISPTNNEPIFTSSPTPDLSISPPATGTDLRPPDLLEVEGFTFPTEIDANARYLFYLHGRLIEEMGLPAISPEFGEYQYLEILKALQRHGFNVISEQRTKGSDVEVYARRVIQQIEMLLEAGVPPGAITVVGASKGAAIAVEISHLMQNPEVNYVLLGTCLPDLIQQWMQGGTTLSGNVLAISDAADTQFAGSCEELFNFSKGQGLSRYEEIILNIGTGHGILYQPLEAWVLPTVKWARQEW